MALISVNSVRQGKDPVNYEEFYVLKGASGELIFDVKKRYVRCFLCPPGAKVPIGREQAKEIILAAEKRLGIKIKKKAGRKIKPDTEGRKVYGEMKDAYGHPIMVRNVEPGKVDLVLPGDCLPHLRERETIALMGILSKFVSE
jgi:hypothetical protein